MRFGTTKTWGIVAAAAALVFAGYSLGTQADDGVANGQGSSAGGKTRFAVAECGPGGPKLEGLADRLGVDRQKLEDALDDIRPAQKTAPGERFAAGLAAKLGIDQAKVEKALEAQGPKRVERGRERRDELSGALAGELGVSEAKVRAALVAVKSGTGGPPAGPDGFANALAKELGVSKDRVQAALDKIRPQERMVRRAGPPIAGLAKALGVEESKLRAALEELGKEQKADQAKRRDEFAQQLADRLGIDVDKVKAALPEPGGPVWKGRP
jgi:hypothetical protein